MIGQTVSHYTILAKLGEGGMGAVYQARDRRLGRMVALKFLPSHLASSPEAVMRFEREAQAISRLNHPKIATLYNFEDLDGAPCLVLEYLPGGTLRDRLHNLRQTGLRIDVDEAVNWALQMAEGIAHAHQHGILHRDIKPGNTMFDAEGRLKITDFGLAKLQGGEDVTQTSFAMGTAAYMAPEQVTGSASVDERADIFSLGVVIYEMLAGQLPFRSDSQLGTLHKIIHEVPEPLETVRPDAPPELAGIVARALAKQPDERYQRVEDLGNDLRRLAQRKEAVSPDGATMALQLPALERAIRPVSRRKWLSAAALALILVAVLAAVVAGQWRETVVEFFGGGDSGEKKLAVLLFENVGDDPEQQAFCDGLGDTIAAAMTGLERQSTSLWVVPASEIRSAAVRSAREARKAFGVNLAVTGSVQRTAGQVRVTVNLVDARAARQLASRTLVARLEELPGLEQQIVQQVAVMLHLDEEASSDRTAESGRGGTAVASAYDYYLRGRGYLQRFDKPGNLDRAQEAFQAALAEDRNYALAYCGLGETYLARHSLTQESRWLAEAQTNSQQALALNASLAPARINLSNLYQLTGRHQEAIHEARRALEIDPLSDDAYRALASAYSSAGMHSQTESTYRQAIDLRPGYWLAYKDLGVYYYSTNRLAEAEAMFRKVIELTPDNEWGYRNLAAVCQITGRSGEAEPLLVKAAQLKPTAESHSNLGTLYYSQTRYAEASAMYEKAVALSPQDPVVWGNLAEAYRWTPQWQSKAEGTYRKAVEIAQRQLNINPRNADLLAALAVWQAKLGDRKQAAASLAKALELGRPNMQIQFQSAIVYELAGSREQALQALREAIQSGYPAGDANREPELAKLRTDPRYKILDAKSH